MPLRNDHPGVDTGPRATPSIRNRSIPNSSNSARAASKMRSLNSGAKPSLTLTPQRPRRLPGHWSTILTGRTIPTNEWARRVSNPRPLVCKTRALPLSYTPVRRHRNTPGPRRRLPAQAAGTEIPQSLSAASASVHSVWSRASPGSLHSANRTTPVRSMTKVPRLANPAPELNTP